MDQPRRLSPGMQRFIESMGIYFEHLELPRITGRILGLLMVTDRPLSLDDMAAALQVSRASASTNIRMAMHFGAAELVSIPGDRRDYYRLAGDVWEHHLTRGITLTTALRRIAEEGLAVLEPADGVACARLQEMRDFCDFSLDELNATLARWRERQRTAARTDRQAGGARWETEGASALLPPSDPRLTPD
jgi:DNA-binding transcriptional regulator GbsR (MarR family)